MMTDPEHLIFPSCQCGEIDASRPQKTFRTAWRSLVEKTAERAGDQAAKTAENTGGDINQARKRAQSSFAQPVGDSASTTSGH